MQAFAKLNKKNQTILFNQTGLFNVVSHSTGQSLSLQQDKSSLATHG